MGQIETEHQELFALEFGKKIAESSLRSIKANVCKRLPTVRLISTVSGERLQPIANGF